MNELQEIILLVEDNLMIIKGIKYALEKCNYQIVYKTTVIDAEKFIEENSKPNLIILDITLPDGDGFSLYEQSIKEKNIPTIFLTAKDDEDDIVKGLNIGADDYMTKPFSIKELIARVNKILLRNKKQNVISIKDIRYDMDKMVVFHNNQKVELSSLEIKLIHLLFMNLNKTVSRNTILDKIWEWTGNDVDDHTVTVYFNRIREKIQTDIIDTVKGVGYRIDEE